MKTMVIPMGKNKDKTNEKDKEEYSGPWKRYKK